ncbi:MAG TPA: peptide deformylase [Candidatus Scybalocola faecigallinarum]|uniref:Peptide deformylase n=1 Tax=Candidatus Scybalocola faecigallinarum TaxID=2840941 RepID=A0A9D1F2T8_9FIRM|nr:peptide deformylase [Candidatus Scybalocola faecigallinarum]
MAIRNLRYQGDSILNKRAKEVKDVTPRIRQLIDDMLDTMYENNGVGLAAPQVGILKRIVVIDVGEGPYVFINPEVLATDGEQTGDEGCLSVPGKCGTVTRPNYVKAKAFDKDMKPFEVEGTELFARAMCHEFDHLDGHLYTERVEGPLRDVTYEDEEGEAEE